MGESPAFVALSGEPLHALVARHGGRLDDAVDPARAIASIGASDRDGDPDLAPVLHARGAAKLASRARVLLVAAAIEASVAVGRRWVHPHADRVLCDLLAVDEPRAFDEALAVHPSASIGEGAFVDVGARIGRGVVIGAGSSVGPNAVIYPGVRLGRSVRIGAGSIVGRAGFGFVDDKDRASGAIAMPHRAGVRIDDEVELGALCTIDAGILAPTSIGAFTKIDAQVHLGHGVVIGARCRIAAQVGFAGSVVVEDDVRIGGQAGFADHVRIGRGARIAAKAGVIGDVPEGEVFAGYPAVARARWLRGHARLYRR